MPPGRRFASTGKRYGERRSAGSSRVSSNESDSDGLARRFGDWLRRHMDANDWSNTSVAIDVWGSENGRGHVSGYLNARKGNPTRLTIMKFCDKLGIPREEGEALLRDAPEPIATPERRWPQVIPLGITTDRNVIGREADVEILRANLTETTAAAITPGSSGGTVVKGRGGMGKTTLARHYIQTHRGDYFGIWWLRAQDRSTVVEDLARLARRASVADTGADAEANAEHALSYLQQQADPWLLVYDNAEAIGPLRDLLPEQDNIHILLTSREGNWPARFIEQPADALPECEAIALLRQESGRAGDVEGATALVHALDRLPLAIVAAGAWLRDVSESFAGYQDRLAERIAEKPPGVTDYPDSVFGAIKLSLDRLSPDAALLMKVFCWLSPDDLWPGLVTGLTEREDDPDPNWREALEPVPEALWTLARDASAVDRAFANLRNRSLLEYEGEDSWRLHRLTQAVQQGVLREEGSDGAALSRGLGEHGSEASARGAGPSQAADVASVAGEGSAVRHPREDGDLSNTGTEMRALAGMTSGDQMPAFASRTDTKDCRAVAAALLAANYPSEQEPQRREYWPLCARMDPHVATLADNDPPTIAAMHYLLNQASLYLDTQRVDDRALRFSEQSLRLMQLLNGEHHKETAIRHNNLAVQYWRSGRMREAEYMAARAVGIAENTSVTEQNKAILLNTHGMMVEAVGRGLTGNARREQLDLAEVRYEHAVEIKKGLRLNRSREITVTLSNLASLHAWQGKWDAAIAGHAEALSIRRAVLNAGETDISHSLYSLAVALLRSGRARHGHEGIGVLDLLEEALAIREDAFARVNHPDRVDTASWVAGVHWVLLELSPPITGTIQPDAKRAAALCESYGLDPDAMKAQAAVYAARAKAHEAGQVIPGEMQLQQKRAERIAGKLAGDWSPRAAYETLSGDLALKDMTEAYQVQEVLQRKYAATRGPIAGRKIALSSKAMQEMVGIDQPIAGAIFANDVHRTGAEISLSTFRHLGLEYELAFELARDVSERVEAGSVLDLVASVRPAFELIEDKAADYSALDVLTLVADNAWCGGVVLGEPIAGWRDLDLGNLPSVLSQEGVADEAGNTSAADPVNSLVWVLNHFVGRGAVLKAGEVMITGSVLKTRFPVPGDRVRYEITGHAAVEVSLVA